MDEKQFKKSLINESNGTLTDTSECRRLLDLRISKTEAGSTERIYSETETERTDSESMRTMSLTMLRHTLTDTHINFNQCVITEARPLCVIQNRM